MTKQKAKIRLYHDSFEPAGSILLSEKDSHYLINVMRRSQGDELVLFNEHQGDWLCTIKEAHKKKTLLQPLSQLRAFKASPSLALYFALIKKQPLDYIIQKGTECGVTAFHPIITDYTDINKINIGRLRATAKESTEQCQRFDLPDFYPVITLKQALKDFNHEHVLYVGAEDGRGKSLPDIYEKNQNPALLIGPEGGFSSPEFDQLSHYDFVRFIDLGPRILRAETAVVAGLTLLNHQRNIS